MKNKLLKILTAGIVIMAMLTSSITLPVTAAKSDETSIGIKKGDKVVLATDVVATVDSVNIDGTVTYTAVMGELKYCNDLVTPIDTAWKFDSGKGIFYIKDNLYYAEVKENKVTITYKGESYNWNPTLYIGDTAQKLTNWASLLNPDTDSFIDPVNENYSGNTLYWQYGDNITRCLRAIEGMLIEYYTIDKMPDSDIRIVTNATKSKGYTYSRPEYAYDATGKSITLTSDSKSSGELLITLDSLKDAVFPITIDPDSSFTTSSADGELYYQDGLWDEAHDAATATFVRNSLDNTYVGASSGLHRGYLYFDTSYLPDNAVISAAVLNIYIFYQLTNAADSIILQTGSAGYPHNPLVAGDYDYTKYSGNGGSLSIPYPGSITGSKNITLNSTGRSWISKTSNTNLCLRTGQDVNDVWASTHNYIRYYNYEKGAGYRPTLTVTYTSTATVTNSTGASLISDTTARLNGSLISDGGLDTTVKVYYGDNDGATTAGNWDSNYDFGVKTAGALYYDISSLTADTTYYYRFFSTNSLGDSWASSTSTFDTYPEPAITLVAASQIAKTSARLNASITEDGNLPCQVRWGYGTTSQAAIEDYDTYTELAGSYSVGNNPYLDITSLVGSTTYYYRVEITNGNNTNLSGELSFETINAISAPSNLRAYPSSTSINLVWNMGEGSSNTLIRYKTNAFPTSTTDGTLAYLGGNNSYIITGLSSGKTYFISIWGESDGEYSSMLTVLATTTETGAGGDSLESPAQPSRWATTPNYANLENMPFYDAVNDMADSLHMPYATFWMILVLFLSTALGIAAYIRFKLSALIAVAVSTGCLIIGWVVQIVPFYLPLMSLIICAALIIGSRKGYLA